LKVYGTVNILGDFWPQRTSDISEVTWASEDEGRILYDSDNDDLYYGASLGWEELTDAKDLFSVGTTLIFASTLPTGWNINTDMDDKVIMLTSITSLIGSNAGQWNINGVNYSSNHNHFTPAGLGSPTQAHAVPGTRSVVSLYTHKHTLSNAGSHKHTFDGNWRPSRVKLTVGVYQE
jgi:hypothetical protein